VMYSGYRGRHGFSYRFPCGMLFGCGPFLRMNDCGQLNASQCLAEFAGADLRGMCLLADSIYGRCRRWLLSTRGCSHEVQDLLGSVRCAIQHIFGAIIRTFARVDTPLRPLGGNPAQLFEICAILHNCISIMRRNKVSLYFDCVPHLTVAEYLALAADHPRPPGSM
jgi:hypothetical protein